MVDWGGSSIQIVIAIIGSGLIVTGLTSLNSFINNPLLNIDVDVTDEPHVANFTYRLYDTSLKKMVNVTYPHADNYTSYRIYLKNVGNSPAKDIRLTMTYPNAKVIDIKPIYVNENTTIRKETSNSVVALFPRLSTKTEVAVENNISGILRKISGNQDYTYPGNDFKVSRIDRNDWSYRHTTPFSIIATYDEGAVKYEPTEFSAFGNFMSEYFNIELLQFYFPIVLAVLLFGIAFRHKRKSISASASNILSNILTVERDLKEYKYSNAIFSFSKDSSIERNLSIFDNYRDYNLINAFYKGLQKRDVEISKAYSQNPWDYGNPVLTGQNKKCFDLATFTRSNIFWKLFFKFDLILLLPAIALGSAFITFICEGLPLLLLVQFGDSLHEWFFALYFIPIFVTRSLGTYYILKWILHKIQGSSLSDYVLPTMSRPKKFFAYCCLIMGLPIFVVLSFTLNFFSNYIQVALITSMILLIAIDFARMLLLTKVVSRYSKRITLNDIFP